MQEYCKQRSDYLKKVFLIMGESGCGKTSIVEALEKRGFKSLQSYTTRKPRVDGETGHTFCSVKEYEQFKDNNEIVAYTYFDDNHYFCTKQQLIDSDLYVIDPSGIKFLKEYVIDVEFITIYIQVREMDRINRMYNRGETRESISKRLQNDNIKFKNKVFDYVVPNNNLKKTTDIIEYIMLVEMDKF